MSEPPLFFPFSLLHLSPLSTKQDADIRKRLTTPRSSCGEHFPRGRLDSLTSHLTKKCPAISEAERVNALLTLSGMSHASQRFQQTQQAQAHAHAQAHAAANGSSVDLPMIQRDWTALGVLAEVSRQIDLNEKNDDRGQPNGAPHTTSAPAGQPDDRFELQDQFTIENPPLSQEGGPVQPAKGML